MNIFQTYLEKIHKVIIELANNNKIIIPESLAGINAEIPPEKFDSDISTNVAMVLSKINKKSPDELAKLISLSLKDSDPLIEDISVIKPGFINIKFKPVFWTKFVEEIINNQKEFGVNLKEEKLN